MVQRKSTVMFLSHHSFSGLLLLWLWIAFLQSMTEGEPQAALPNDLPSLQPVNISGLSFLVGPVHHDWVLDHEQHVVKQLQRSVEEARVLHSSSISSSSSNSSTRKSDYVCTMIDVGTNDGFYSNMAGALGCKVWGFEIQRRCMEIAYAALSANHLHSQVTIFQATVSNVNNEMLWLPHHNGACDGLYSLGRTDCPQCPKRDEAHHYEKHRFHTVMLDAFVGPQTVINFVKIDTEGHDPEVLEGAEELFKSGRILNAVVESAPKMWAPRTISATLPSQNQIFEHILDYGYEFTCISATSLSGWPTLKFTAASKKQFIEKLHTNQCVDWLFQLIKK